MPRPRKCRKVCQLPAVRDFVPADSVGRAPILMTVDEYEAIRLIDRQGFSQEQCAAYMQVGRTTVQAIYNEARRKLAIALVDALPLHIEGGDYELCRGEEEFCDCGGCRRHRRKCMQMEFKEDKPMKIAIALDENRQDVCIVLARAPYFLFEEDGVETIVENPAAQAQGGAGIQAAQFLVDQGVDALITVRCGQNAADVFTAAGMKIYKSQSKNAKDELAAFHDGRLEKLTQFHGGFHGVH